VETPREGRGAVEPVAVGEGIEGLEAVALGVRPFEASGGGEAVETVGVAEAEVFAEDGTVNNGSDALRLRGEGEQVHAVAVVSSGVGGEVDALLLVERQTVGDVAVQVPVAVDAVRAVGADARGSIVGHALYEGVLPEGIAQGGVEVALFGLLGVAEESCGLVLVLIAEVGIAEADDERCAVVAPADGLNEVGRGGGVLIIEAEMTLACPVPVVVDAKFQTRLEEEAPAAGEGVDSSTLVVDAVGSVA